MAKLTPGASQGGVQPSTSTEFDPVEGGKPVTGFTEAPASDRPKGGPGQGIGCSSPGIR
jgi:hypothetical protein